MLEKLLGGSGRKNLDVYPCVHAPHLAHESVFVSWRKEPEGDYRWYSCEEYREIPLAGPHAKLAAYIEPYLEE
ncbi:MAG: hypothetical protein ACLUIQ_05305 [Dialister invisus]